MEDSVFIEGGFWLLAIAAVIVKIIRWIKVKGSSSREFMLLQLRYFVGYYTMQLPLTISGPFVHLRYVECNLSSTKIVNLRIIFNVLCAVVSIFTGACLNGLGHQKVVIVAVISSIACNYLRYRGIGNDFLFAMIAAAIAAPLAKVAFDDWFFAELKTLKDIPNDAHCTFTENNALMSLIVSIAASSAGSYIQDHYSIQHTFLVATIGLVISLIPIALFFKSKASKTKKEGNGGFSLLANTLIESKDTKFKLMIIIDALFSMTTALFVPGICSYFMTVENLPAAQLSSSFSIATLWGAQLLSLFKLKSPSFGILSLYFVSEVACYVLMWLFYTNKKFLFIMLCCIGLAHGGSAAVMLSLRQQLYPSNIRGYTLSLIKLLASVLSTGLMQAMKPRPEDQQILITGLEPAAALLLSLWIMHIKVPRKTPGKKD